MLTSFVLLLVPRDLWHRCVHIESTETNDNKVHHIDQSDCPICDFHFFTATLPTAVSIFYSKKIVVQFVAASISQIILKKTQSFLRGPPIYNV